MADNNRGTGSYASQGEDDDAEVQAGKRQKFSQMERKIEFKYLTHWMLIFLLIFS